VHGLSVESLVVVLSQVNSQLYLLLIFVVGIATLQVTHHFLSECLIFQPVKYGKKSPGLVHFEVSAPSRH
jgi:hypothetical protein